MPRSPYFWIELITPPRRALTQGRWQTAVFDSRSASISCFAMLPMLPSSDMNWPWPMMKSGPSRPVSIMYSTLVRPSVSRTRENSKGDWPAWSWIGIFNSSA